MQDEQLNSAAAASAERPDIATPSTARAPDPTEPPGSADDENADPKSDRLSYKFQRLRERLREAIASGDLHGKLPGERQLAKKFRVNAKTLSKALTDLAAEGLLDRSIGRGTFVKGSDAASKTTPGEVKWLILADSEQASSPLIAAIQKLYHESQVVYDTAGLRPSFLNQFSAVIDMASHTHESFLREMIVRNLPVVLVDREPTNFSMHAVVNDRLFGATKLARELMLAGHRRFFVVELADQAQIFDAVQKAAARYAPDATVEKGFAPEVTVAIERGSTAILCDSCAAAAGLLNTLARKNIAVPNCVSIAAVDSGTGDYPCSGYFVSVEQQLETIKQLLTDPQYRRPSTLWLAGAFHDANTMGPTDVMTDTSARQHVNEMTA